MSLSCKTCSLEVVATVKGGQRLLCPVCAVQWFRSQSGRQQYQLLPENQGVFDYWCSRSLRLTSNQQAVAQAIGGIERQYLECLEIPCGLELLDGTVSQRALLTFTALPPRGNDSARLVWPEQVTRIFPSHLALPLEIRQRSAATPEQSMGFAPLPLIGSSEKLYTLGEFGHFLLLKGEETTRFRLGNHRRGILGWPRIVYPRAPEIRVHLDPV